MSRAKFKCAVHRDDLFLRNKFGGQAGEVQSSFQQARRCGSSHSLLGQTYEIVAYFRHQEPAQGSWQEIVLRKKRREVGKIRTLMSKVNVAGVHHNLVLNMATACLRKISKQDSVALCHDRMQMQCKVSCRPAVLLTL